MLTRPKHSRVRLLTPKASEVHDLTPMSSMAATSGHGRVLGRTATVLSVQSIYNVACGLIVSTEACLLGLTIHRAFILATRDKERLRLA
jgi:hypothetical protein